MAWRIHHHTDAFPLRDDIRARLKNLAGRACKLARHAHIQDDRNIIKLTISEPFGKHDNR
jgi:hypothetical protein